MMRMAVWLVAMSILIGGAPSAAQASITRAWGYSSTCGNQVTCNKPEWSRDARGSNMNFTYDPQHGGVLTEMAPADYLNSGPRPLKVTTWAQRYAWRKNGAGTLVQIPTAVWVKASETQCQTVSGINPAPVCDPSGPQIVTTYEYGANGTGHSLLVKGVVVTANGASLRTCYGYDAWKRRISETQPNANLSSCP